MATVSELVRDILGSVAGDAGGPAVGKWIDNRYQEMVSAVKFRSLRQVGELVIPAVVDNGTVHTFRGAEQVVGLSTTWTAAPTTTVGDDWYFRSGSAWYRVASVTDGTNLTLDSAFSEDGLTSVVEHGTYTWSNSSGSEYRLDDADGDAQSITDTITYVYGDGLAFTEGTLTSLNASEWVQSSNNLYVRLADDADPDTKRQAFVTYSTASTGDSYRLAKRNHSLSADARRLGTFVHSRLRKELMVVSSAELNILAPGRILVSSLPNYVAEIGEDTNGYKQVEIYPPPGDSEIIHYIYWKIPTALTLSTTIPQIIDGYVLKEGALVDAYRYEKAKALRVGNIDQAATWANEEHKQRTRWERYLKHAARQDRGVDDMTLILSMMSDKNRHRHADIVTAQDHVLANWNYPS